MTKKNTKDQVWDHQQEALRDPEEVISQHPHNSGLISESLEFEISGTILKALEKLKISILVTREYEHLVLCLQAEKKQLNQTYFHLPHPSGMVVDHKNQDLYIAATRNPNQIWKLKITEDGYLVPVQTKFFPGHYYFHDLAMIGNDLYGNSVGQNAVTKIDFKNPNPDPLAWWPKALEGKKGQPDFSLNYLQLNSIAAGPTLKTSYFSASSDRIRDTRPGDIKYPVDGTGVIFSGKTREVFATGLTRPHSARFYKDELWVDNSGYGTVGKIVKGVYQPMITLPGWTRGLCFIDDIMLVGVSRVLPKFAAYAPGLKHQEAITCGIFAVDMKTLQVMGSIIWPYGNQIFAIDYIKQQKNFKGFPFKNFKDDLDKKTNVFYKYQINKKETHVK